MERLKEEQGILSPTKLPKNNSEIFAGWVFQYNEVSNGVYQFELRDKFGHLAGCTDHDFERGIETCASYAFDIEKRLWSNLNWNRFLFDICKFELLKYKLKEEIYHEEDFRSWMITFEKYRVILNGKHHVLISQYQDKKGNWVDRKEMELANLTFDKIKSITDLLIEDSHIPNGATKVERGWWRKLMGSSSQA